jgi:hypothetical protein
LHDIAGIAIFGLYANAISTIFHFMHLINVYMSTYT